MHNKLSRRSKEKKERKTWTTIMIISTMSGQGTRDSSCSVQWIMMKKTERLIRFMIWWIDKWTAGEKRGEKRK